MRKFLLFLVLAACAASSVAAQTVEEIVAANVAERGGLEAWRAVSSLRMSGVMDVGRGMQVPFSLQLERPRKMRLEFLFDGQMVVQAFDGESGWKRRPYLGRDSVEPLTPEEIEAAAGQVELDGPFVDYVAKGHRLALLGKEEVEGRAAFKIAVTLANGAVRNVYVDAENFLEVKVDGTRRLAGQDRPFETFYRDYRKVGGLLMSHQLETRAQGAPAANSMRIERIETNVPMDDAIFAPPKQQEEDGTKPRAGRS